MRTFRGAAVAVTAATVLALAACGPLGNSASKGGSTIAPGTAVANAGSRIALAADALDLVAKRTSNVHSAKIEATLSIGGTAAMTSKGAMDWSNSVNGDLTITYTGGTTAQAMKKAGLGGSLQARYLPDAYYVEMGPTMASHLGGKHWIRYGYADFVKFTGSSGAFLKDAMSSSNPVKIVQFILASDSVHKVGTDSVRGVQATHYAGTLKAATISRKAAPHLTDAQWADIQAGLKKAGITTEKIDLWVSADNLPVKTLSSSETKTGVITSTTYYSDFGVPFHITAPPASDYMNFIDVVKLAQAGKTR